MGLFSRRPQQNQPLLTASPEDLQRIGRAAFGGESPHPAGIGGLSVTEMDQHVLAAMSAGEYVSPGSPKWPARQRGFLGELIAASELGGDWAWVGAFCVANNLVTEKSDPVFLQILDRALLVLRDDGVSHASMPPYAVSRWENVFGYDGGRPAKWPASITDVAVPRIGEEPAVEDLALGESRRVAQPFAGSQSNVIYAEWSSEGRVVAVIDGIDQGDGVRKRWEWIGLDAPSYVRFLRELGERLVNPSFWAHDDLAPYFPCRPRSRDQMRIAARAMAD